MSYPKLLFFLCSREHPTVKKTTEKETKKPQKKRKIFRSTKEEQTERERERETERKREEHRRADATEKERGEMIKLVAAKVPRLFSSLVLVFVFSTFFSSSG